MNVALPPPEHRTVEAREHHHIGEGGLPVAHTSQLVVEALARMIKYPYRFDTNTARVEATTGGTAGEVYEVGDGIHAVDITLDEPLEPGERATIAYDTEFSYRTPPPPEFRRTVGATGMEHLVMQVTFQPEKLPHRISWAQWNGYGPDAQIVPGTEELVELSPMNAEPDAPLDVWRELSNVPSGVYGYRWEW